ncbi:BTAD domain-containing putative transcriptional regulator [Amycolatopsis rhabdoformis]|uniref:BTAD domain-containing putative transcriptional regulator n=1 Tax=Amycolatopsis rhabdoformis TaxID=1448059 RepID=A0ABZ1I5F9_9PSEU|nr:BTAD domain-containing putative transcriptional regulator [Amycolatopsis rhabdoformis]WSE29669.1 BTAD domain-containing putative transcriptional regulator [Amycolatopsis rhabdoformis]
MLSQNVRFDLLGALRFRTDAGAHAVRGPQITKILSLLALAAGRSVDTEALVDELWPGSAPARAIGTLRTHVYHLRRLLTGLGAPGAELVRTEPSGYVLDVAPEQVDALRFEQLAARARMLLAAGQSADAAAAARSGLALWRGSALAGVPLGRRLEGHARRLDELHRQTVRVSVDAELALGRHEELLPALRELVAHHPYDEGLHASLIEVLRRCDRRADALRAYRDLRTTLEGELGVAPSPRLLSLRGSILADAAAVPDRWLTAVS